MASIRASVFPDNRTSATVQDGETIVATKVLVPGTVTMVTLPDVDATTLNDGSVIVYNATTTTFVVTDNVSNTGTNYINGGTF